MASISLPNEHVAYTQVEAGPARQSTSWTANFGGYCVASFVNILPEDGWRRPPPSIKWGNPVLLQVFPFFLHLLRGANAF